MLPKSILLLLLPVVLAAPVIEPRALPWASTTRPYRDLPHERLPAVREAAPAPAPSPTPATAPTNEKKPVGRQPGGARQESNKADVFRVSEGNSVALFNGKPVDLATGGLVVKNINEKRNLRATEDGTVYDSRDVDDVVLSLGDIVVSGDDAVRQLPNGQIYSTVQKRDVSEDEGVESSRLRQHDNGQVYADIEKRDSAVQRENGQVYIERVGGVQQHANGQLYTVEKRDGALQRENGQVYTERADGVRQHPNGQVYAIEKRNYPHQDSRLPTMYEAVNEVNKLNAQSEADPIDGEGSSLQKRELRVAEDGTIYDSRDVDGVPVRGTLSAEPVDCNYDKDLGMDEQVYVVEKRIPDDPKGGPHGPHGPGHDGEDDVQFIFTEHSSAIQLTTHDSVVCFILTPERNHGPDHDPKQHPIDGPPIGISKGGYRISMKDMIVPDLPASLSLDTPIEVSAAPEVDAAPAYVAVPAVPAVLPTPTEGVQTIVKRDLRKKLGLDFLSSPDNDEAAMREHLRDPSVGVFNMPGSDRRVIDHNLYANPGIYGDYQPGYAPSFIPPFAPQVQKLPEPVAPAPAAASPSPTLLATAAKNPELKEEFETEPKTIPWKGKSITVFNGQPVSEKAAAPPRRLHARDIYDHFSLPMFNKPTAGRRKNVAPVEEEYEDAQEYTDEYPEEVDEEQYADEVVAEVVEKAILPATPVEEAPVNENGELIGNGKSFVIYNGVPVEINGTKHKNMRTKKPRPAFRNRHEESLARLEKRDTNPEAGKKIPNLNPFSRNPITRHQKDDHNATKKEKTEGTINSNNVVGEATSFTLPRQTESEKVNVNKGGDFVLFNGEKVGTTADLPGAPKGMPGLAGKLGPLA